MTSTWVGTQKVMPVCFPFSSGLTLPTALSVPEARMMFWAAPQPSCHSFSEMPSGSSGGSDGMGYGPKPLNRAQVVMGDLIQASQAVGASSIADNIEEVMFFMVHTHHK